MHIIKKIMILAILIMAFYSISLLFANKKKIQQHNRDLETKLEKKNLETNVEGFSPNDEIKQLEKTTRKNGTQLNIKEIPDKYFNMPLRQFIVKSSFNSAISGKYASVEALKITLARGFRFVDFEVFNREKSLYVSYTGDPEFRSMDTENEIDSRLKLRKAMNTLSGSAFSSPSPIYNAPLFVHLRIRNNNQETYSLLSEILTTAFGDKLFKGEVNGSTLIKDILNKVIIVLDKSSAPDYKNYAKCITSPNTNCIPFDSLVNIESGTVELMKYNYAEYGMTTPNPIMPASSNSDDLNSNITSFIMVVPDSTNTGEPDVMDIMKNKPAQFILYKYYDQSDALINYEQLFNEFGTAFIPITKYINKINEKNSDRNSDQYDE